MKVDWGAWLYLIAIVLVKSIENGRGKIWTVLKASDSLIAGTLAFVEMGIGENIR